MHDITTSVSIEASICNVPTVAFTMFLILAFDDEIWNNSVSASSLITAGILTSCSST
jgi:hypothetical protein